VLSGEWAWQGWNSPVGTPREQIQIALESKQSSQGEIPLTVYVLRRLISLIPVLFGITLMAFILGNLAPGDPAEMVYISKYGEFPPNSESVERIREELGLNDPAVVRYVRWLGGALRGQMGSSYRTGLPVIQEFISYFPMTARLAVSGLTLGVLMAFPLGVVAAVYQNSLPDVTVRFFSMLGAAMPSFWVAYLLILFFSVRLHLLPVAGVGTWRHFILPSLVLSIGSAASLSRLLRSSLLEVLRSDYIRAARARGVRGSTVILVHAMRNAMIPVVTHMGNIFGYLIAGAVIVETVFAIPGLGRLIMSAISFRDYPVIQGFVVFTGTLFLAVNLGVDLLYVIIDPRVQLTNRRGARG
jgi:ABC-type dipeptide/oligopeptide/nickel transport system permease component